TATESTATESTATESTATESTEAEQAGPSAGAVDILAALDPSILPRMQFSTAEFSIGDKNLGAWKFNFEPGAGGGMISGLEATLGDARIAGVAQEQGASLEWRYQGGVHETQFEGRFTAGDLAKVLPGLGLNASVESKNARIDGKLQWPGSPAAFSFRNASGVVNLDINDGRFVKIDAGSARLLGAFSMDAIVRRLQLDFSDIYKKGLAYDSIAGKFNVSDGLVKTDGKLLIQGPSSKITIDGEIDLKQETIDADMLVNVPLSQNLSLLAGLLGAWPIALSTYVASKIFENQMDDFTSIVYRLEGPWEDLNAGFEPPEDLKPPAAGPLPPVSAAP
ncbi:MAG: AsmA-like C-terminal region-containing protein, partial [Pseudomonadales bacterium]|nr:AsmA-like C-terminal region-containing protein [Pseudomonadales bacterium]